MRITAEFGSPMTAVTPEAYSRSPPGKRRGLAQERATSDNEAVRGLALWALDTGSDPGQVVALAVSATTGAMLSMATKDRIAALGIPPVSERWIGFLLGGRDARLLIVTIGALFGQPVATLVVLIATSALSLAVRLLLVRATWPGAWRPR